MAHNFHHNMYYSHLNTSDENLTKIHTKFRKPQVAISYVKLILPTKNELQSRHSPAKQGQCLGAYVGAADQPNSHNAMD